MGTPTARPAPSAGGAENVTVYRGVAKPAIGPDAGPVLRLTVDQQQLVAIGRCVALIAMSVPAAIPAWTEEAV